MATRVWSQVPGAAYWGTLPSNISSTLPSTHHQPTVSNTSSLPPRQRNLSLKFYDFAEDIQDEKDLHEWMKKGLNHGAIRVYQPGSTYSELINCDTETTAEIVMSKCVTNDLYVYYAGQSSEPLGYDSRPLEIQNKFLQSLGYTDPERIQFEGTREDLAYMFKFVAGKEENKVDERVQLTCTIKVKEVSSFSFWSKRFCVLCGCQLHIFSSSTPKGKPSLTLDLAGGSISEHETKKHLYCLEIATGKKTVLLSFESRYDQSIWLKRAAKVVTKHPLEANLSRCSLNRLPKYIFLNKNLAALNMSHNYMLEVVESPQYPSEEGWINDIQRFSHLKILSLSDNNLVHFPVSVCNIVTLAELDLSCNRIKVIPQDIQRLRQLTTLLLHSNLISTLPYHLHNLHKLTTLVIAFNRFKTIPHIVKELESLRILIAAGNTIHSIPEDINRIQTLQILDVRLNKIATNLPSTLPELTILFSLNIRGNSITELDMKRGKNLHVINCSDNSIRSLTLYKGKLGALNARNNSIAKLSIASSPLNLTSLDLSKNQLTLLPESLAQLVNLEKLLLNHNRLSALPKNLLRTPQKLKILHASNNFIIRLPAIAETCRLESLDVHSNKITELPPNIFISCEKLQQLNISNNPITVLPPSTASQLIIKPHSILELRACNCSLTNESTKVIKTLRKLKLLHLAYNSLKTVPSEIFALPDLEYLNVAGNQVSSIYPPPYSCPRMICIVLHTNSLTEFPVFPSMPAVETLDLSCNDIQKMPQLQTFRRLKMLDLSHNKNIEIKLKDTEHLKFLQYFGLSGVRNAIEIKKAMGDCVDISDTLSTHDLWTYGTANIRGTNLSKTGDCCMQHVVVPTLNDKRNDGLFGMVDGGKAPDAAVKIKKKIPSIVNAEFLASEQRKKLNVRETPLQYIEHSFLTMHRRLGSIGLKYGASLVLAHLCIDDTSGDVKLNIGNTGLGEVVMCTGSKVTPLVIPHNPANNKEEIERVVKQKGFISEDDRVNGVCGVSRLLGCYYLHPEVIPLPNTQTMTVPTNSNYLILASHGLWKFLTYKEVVRMSRGSYEPPVFARKLADVAIGCGCPLDVSVLVVKLNLERAFLKSFEKGPVQSEVSKRYSTVSGVTFEDEEAYESEDLEEEEEIETTNIDDIIEEAFLEDSLVQQENSHLESDALRAISPDQLDALIMSSPNVNDVPVIEYLNSESLILQGSSEDLHEDIAPQEEEEELQHTSILPIPESSNNSRPISSTSSTGDTQTYIIDDDKPIELLQDIPEMSPLEDDYETSKTFPRNKVQLKNIDFKLDSSFDQAQSVPADINSSEQKEVKRRFSSPSNPALQTMNRVMSEMESDEEGSERKLMRKRSFVQTSYSRLSRHLVSNSSIHSIQ